MRGERTTHVCAGTPQRMDSPALDQLALRPGTTAASSGHQVARVGTSQGAASSRLRNLEPGRSWRTPGAIRRAVASQEPAWGTLRKTAFLIGSVGSSSLA